MTLRQVYYALEGHRVLEKTDTGYRQAQAEVLRVRKEGLLDWDFITGGTRVRRRPSMSRNLPDYMDTVAYSYQRNVRLEQPWRVEIWLEKDALASAIRDVTAKWGASLMVTRGVSSTTFIYNAVADATLTCEYQSATTFVDMLYDADGGGNHAARTIAKQLPEFAGAGAVELERIAVTEDEILERDLPTQPATTSDPEAHRNQDYAVGLDAMPLDKLTGLVEGAIIARIYFDAWDEEREIQQGGRARPLGLAHGWS